MTTAETQPAAAPRLLALAGVVAPILFVLGFLIAGVLRPGYDRLGQAIDDLGMGGPAPWLQNANFVVCGLLLIAFARGFDQAMRPLLAPRARALSTGLLVLSAAGWVSAGLFTVATPLLHDLAAVLTFDGLAAALGVIGAALRRVPDWLGYARYSLITAVATLVLFGLQIAIASQAAPALGLVNRVLVVEALAWYVVFGRRLLARERPVRKWTGLRSSMTFTYTLTTFVVHLVIDLLLVGIVFSLWSSSPQAAEGMIAGVSRTAKLYALAAAAQAGGTALDPRTTFAPNRPGSIALSKNDSSDAGAFEYFASGANAPADAAFAVLVAPDGRVLASSYPARYPPGSPVAQPLANRWLLIHDALAGRPGGTADPTGLGRVVAAAEPVRSHDAVIGAVYVQTAINLSTFLIPAGGGVLAATVFLLLLSLPGGILFSVLTTRGLVRRFRRLAAATSRFAAGDYTQRVSIQRKDEVGQLEQNFNEMADQLVAGMAQRQILTEQTARQAERARIEQELRTAQQIQQSLLPKEVPALPGWHFTPYYRPAQEVGGDFYDFLPLAGGRWGIVIGDVSGKGVPAALVMAITRTMLRTAAGTSTSPGAVLARVNDLLSGEIAHGMFVTCFYALLDPTTGQLCYANAGHDLPYRWHGDAVLELRARGMPLGLMPGSVYEEAQMTLTPGDCVLFYSDGLVEAHNPRREMFGFPRLMDLVRRQAGAASLVDCLRVDLATFTGANWQQEDDVTLVVMRRTPSPAEIGPLASPSTEDTNDHE